MCLQYLTDSCDGGDGCGGGGGGGASCLILFLDMSFVVSNTSIYLAV